MSQFKILILFYILNFSGQEMPLHDVEVLEYCSTNILNAEKWRTSFSMHKMIVHILYIFVLRVPEHLLNKIHLCIFEEHHSKHLFTN